MSCDGYLTAYLDFSYPNGPIINLISDAGLRLAFGAGLNEGALQLKSRSSPILGVRQLATPDNKND